MLKEAINIIEESVRGNEADEISDEVLKSESVRNSLHPFVKDRCLRQIMVIKGQPRTGKASA